MEAVNSVITCSATVGVVLSIIMYGFGVWLRDKTKIDALNPLLISIASIIVFLLVFHVDYENYKQSAQYLSYLLTPATVALAIPLYKQLEILKKNIKAILIGVLSGVLTSLGSVLLLSRLFGLDHSTYVTLLPKSITTAIGMGISQELGGYVTISVAVIIMSLEVTSPFRSLSLSLPAFSEMSLRYLSAGCSGLRARFREASQSVRHRTRSEPRKQ